jgi:uncharacterized oxidoreductase
VVADLLATVGTPPAAATLVADHLVDAELAGHASHGLIRLDQYCEDARSGMVLPAATPRVAQRHGAVALIDGGRGWGPPAAQLAIDTAVATAAETGIAAAAVHRSYHVGRLSPYVERAAAAGLIGQAYCNVQNTARTAPWGGIARKLGTNPLAIAVPRGDAPIVADLATSAVAEGKVRVRRAEGRTVPLGWVIDETGTFTTDPERAYTTGSLAPLGADQGHKGYCLSVINDILGGLVPGGACGLMTSEYGNGVLFQVLDPAAFGSAAALSARIDAYVAYLQDGQAAAGTTAIRLPGDIERERADAAREHGITVPAGVWRRLQKLAESLGVSLPAR